MCTPLIIAGIALTAGSMVSNSIAANQVDNARSHVLHAEAQRQQSLNREAAAINAQSQDSYANFAPQQDERAAQLGDILASKVGDPNAVTAAIVPESSSDIVNQETAGRMADAQSYVDQQSNALADLRSFGDLLGDKSILQARNAGKVAQIGGFKQGSQSVMPYELDDAAKAGDGMKMFGDILRMGGSIATGAGINGGSIPNMFG